MNVALYRYFDADDRLLYVGVSNAPIRRMEQHEAGKGWAPLIARVMVERHETRGLALRAEARAIATETPAHNPPRRQATPHVRRDPDLDVWRVWHEGSGRATRWMDEGAASKLVSRFNGVYEPEVFCWSARPPAEALPVESENELTEAWLDATLGKTVHAIRAR